MTTYQDAGYVYAIKNRVNGHAYIGSTVNYKSRWHTHRSTLRRGVHHSFILQAAWNKYGEHEFEFVVLLVCAKDQRIYYEQRLMKLESYNVSRTPKESTNRGGWTHSDEFKKKMSAVHKGKKLTAEHKEKLSESAKLRVYDAAFCNKAKIRQTGVSPSPETRKKLSTAISASRAQDVQKSSEIARKIHMLCTNGATTRDACRQEGISKRTFYKYVAELKLPMLGRKKMGEKYDV